MSLTINKIASEALFTESAIRYGVFLGINDNKASIGLNNGHHTTETLTDEEQAQLADVQVGDRLYFEQDKEDPTKAILINVKTPKVKNERAPRSTGSNTPRQQAM